MPAKSQPVPELIAFLDSRVEELRRLAPKALRSSEVTAVHQARVITRRLKSAVDLLEPVLPKETREDFKRVLRRLRRALGPLRDNQVMSEHLASYERHAKLAPAARWFSTILETRRKELQRRAARKAPVQEILKSLGGWWAMEHDLREGIPASKALVKRSVPKCLESFVDRANHLADLRAKNPSQQHEDVHALRIDGKLLRYTLELAVPAGFDVPAPLFRSFKKLQDALGLWHDYVVLGEECLRAALDEELPLHDPHLYGDVLALAARCWRDSEMQLHCFSRLWIKNGASIEADIRGRLGLVSQTTTKLAGAEPSPAAALLEKPAKIAVRA
jgi:CHAD domain-containing protein